MTSHAPTPHHRQHHFDALRAFAMLLGVALHAGLSFTTRPWLIPDIRKSDLLFWLVEGIHGFRMPLFFLVSGYFTMLLYRRRGLGTMLHQRFQRVVVPLLLGMYTLLPLTQLLLLKLTDADTNRLSSSRPKSPLVEAIRAGDRETVQALLREGVSPNEPDAEFAIPPLGWAALHGDEELTRMLLASGANVHGKTRDGYRPLHQAAWLGQREVARVLLEAGADLHARSGNLDTWRESARADWKTTASRMDSLRLPRDSEPELTRRRIECVSFLEGKEAEEKASTNLMDRLDAQLMRWREAYLRFIISPRWSVRMSQEGSPYHLMLNPRFDHLWFLWFLCWYFTIFALTATVGSWLRLSCPSSWLASSPFRMLWLVPLTLVPQIFMGVYGSSFLLGPDTSSSVLPQPHVLVYYGIFFNFGLLYHESHDRAGRLGRWWWVWFVVALLTIPLIREDSRVILVSGLARAVYPWAMIFGLIGLFRRLLHRESWTVRYLSDSAYWLYLVHLPPIYCMQALVRDGSLSPLLKFAIVCAGSTGVLLISYQLLVRHTYLGVLLNGHRERLDPKKGTF